MAGKVSGAGPGQRQLNGIQTTGRDYRALSTPDYGMTQDDDVAVPMRDGISLLADVIRPDGPGKFPVLIAGTSSINRVAATSRLLLPLAAGKL